MTVASVEERAALKEVVERSLERHAGPRPWLATDDGPATIDPALWRLLTEQLGLTALLIPESCGGVGGSCADLAVAIEATGAGLAPVPMLASAGMATALLVIAARTSTVQALFDRLGGGAVATMAWPDVASSDPSEAALPVRATDEHGRYRLTGTVPFVLNGLEADVVLVPASTSDGVAVFAVEVAGAGVTRRSMTTFDLTRGLAELVFDDADGDLVVPANIAKQALDSGYDVALALLAAEQVGIAQHCLGACNAYVKERVQFDRPIGSFQAVQHSLVDMLLKVELARSAMDEAISAADRYLSEPSPEAAAALRASASLAKAMCGETATAVARQSLHLFGGIGFTWEHDAHLYYRRAITGELFLGDPSRHRARLAAAVGL